VGSWLPEVGALSSTPLFFGCDEDLINVLQLASQVLYIVRILVNQRCIR
jgi:hypothetical protein